MGNINVSIGCLEIGKAMISWYVEQNARKDLDGHVYGLFFKVHYSGSLFWVLQFSSSVDISQHVFCSPSLYLLVVKILPTTRFYVSFNTVFIFLGAQKTAFEEDPCTWVSFL